MTLSAILRRSCPACFAPETIVGCDAAPGAWEMKSTAYLGVSDTVETRASGSSVGAEGPPGFVSLRIERTRRGVTTVKYARYDEADPASEERCRIEVDLWLLETS